MKKNIILSTTLFITLFISCNKIEPINIVENKRDINTELLKKQKENLNDRQISVGIIYGWGKEERSNLMHTPDDLDIIIIKDGYNNISDYQRLDLMSVKEKKATRVLINLDFETFFEKYNIKFTQQIEESLETLEKEETDNFEITIEQLWEIEKERLKEKYPEQEDWFFEVYHKDPFIEEKRIEFERELEAIKIKTADSITKQLFTEERKDNPEDFISPKQVLDFIQINSFDGICIQIPEEGLLYLDYLNDFFELFANDAAKQNNIILIVENPIKKITDNIIKADWVIYRQSKEGSALLSEFRDAAKKWEQTKFLPSVDFSREDLKNGFMDTEEFTPEGNLPMPIDIAKWEAPNKSGVAFYHIEENYTDINGNITYNMLRQAIKTLLNK